MAGVDDTKQALKLQGTLLMDFRNFLRRFAVSLSLATAGVALGQAPTIVTDAESVTTYTGYPATLRLTVASTNSAPSFQWYLAGVGALPGSFTNVSGATNATLSFTKLALANNGAYYAIITNRSGAVTSAPVNLFVLVPPQAAVNFGELTTPTPDTAAVQISYASQGTETNVSFSVSFDGAVLTDPVFEVAPRVELPDAPAGTTFGQAADSVAITVSHTSSTDGPIDALGINLNLDHGRVFAAGERVMGTLRWRVASERSAYAGRLGFANGPSLLKARSITNGVYLDLVAGQAPPVLLGRDGVPHLDRQTGLYLQTLTVANPGYAVLTNARLTVVSLPVDSQANQIVVYNSPGRIGAGAIMDIGLLPAGGLRPLTLEYFVPNHAGWPTLGSTPILPEFSTGSVLPPGRTTPAAVVLADAKVRVTRQSAIPNAGFSGVLLDFPTQTNRVYYVQYSAQPDFTHTNDVRLVLPPVPGTGSTVQWLDNGPPKTESFPADTANRFYRILEVR